MRIIAGKARGRVLPSPRDPRIRPTSDRVKEALFNIVAPWISGAKVLDLFAGTGNLGLEALSRGAAWAVFVDVNRDSVRDIAVNLDLVGFAPQGEVLREDAVRAVGILGKRGLCFDLVFVDPPYGKGYPSNVLPRLDTSGILNKGAIIAVEHSRQEKLSGPFQDLQLWKERRYGDTVLTFFRH